MEDTVSATLYKEKMEDNVRKAISGQKKGLSGTHKTSPVSKNQHTLLNDVIQGFMGMGG